MQNFLVFIWATLCYIIEHLFVCLFSCKLLFFICLIPKIKQAKLFHSILPVKNKVLSVNLQNLQFFDGSSICFLDYALLNLCVASSFSFSSKQQQKNWSSCISLLSFFNVNFDSFSPAVITTTMNMMKMIKKMKK